MSDNNTNRAVLVDPNTLFNPNELILEKIRSVEEYDPETMELKARYNHIKDPSLQTKADELTVTDAMGTRIATFYNAQEGTFGFTNALFSLDLVASQFGTEKQVGHVANKILDPVSEILTIDETTHTATLKYVPYGAKGAEIRTVRVINYNNTFGKTYVVSSSGPTDNNFTLDAAKKTITFPESATGRVFVSYVSEKENIVKVSKKTDALPKVVTLWIHAIFHDPCNTNIVYKGTIVCHRAQIDPTSVEIGLTPDGGHAANYILQKPYCDEDAKLFDIIVSKD